MIVLAIASIMALIGGLGGLALNKHRTWLFWGRVVVGWEAQAEQYEESYRRSLDTVITGDQRAEGEVMLAHMRANDKNNAQHCLRSAQSARMNIPKLLRAYYLKRALE